MNSGLLRLLMTLQHSWDNQRGFNGYQHPGPMDDSDLQTNQYGYSRRLYQPPFNCNAKVHGVYLNK